MSRDKIDTWFLNECQKLHPKMSVLELLEYYQEKARSVPRIDTEEARMVYAMREEIFGQGPIPGDPDYDREKWLDHPISKDDPCYRCGMRTNRQRYDADCASECK